MERPIQINITENGGGSGNFLSDWGIVSVDSGALNVAPINSSVTSRRRFLGMMGVGAVATTMPSLGSANQDHDVSIDRRQTEDEEREHKIFDRLEELFTPYLKNDFKYYKPKLTGPKSPCWQIKLKQKEVIKKGEYILRPGEEVLPAPYDMAVKAEGSFGQGGTDKSLVIAVIQKGTPIITKRIELNGKYSIVPVEIATCANPIIDFKMLCLKEIKMPNGRNKKFLYSKTSNGTIFVDEDHKTYTAEQLGKITNSTITIN